MHVRLRPLDVHEVIRQAAASCRADGEAKGLRIGLELWARRHQISGDSSKLYQVFTNLIGNAVKFTPAGGSLSIRSDDRAGDQIRIEVQDSGIGIEPEAIARIFDPFDQGDDVVTRNFGGLGLGLAISKNLVGLHGGTIAASSAGKGHGAMFTILIPVLPDEQRVDQLELQETKI